MLETDDGRRCQPAVLREGVHGLVGEGGRVAYWVPLTFGAPGGGIAGAWSMAEAGCEVGAPAIEG